MFFVLAAGFPVLLLLAVLGMEHVERRLRVDDTAAAVERFLAVGDAEPDEIETFVEQGYADAVARSTRRSRRAARAGTGRPLSAVGRGRRNSKQSVPGTQG